MTEANAPAYPVKDNGNIGSIVHTGLTKRQYFAGMAMQGLLANNYKEYCKAEDEFDTMAKVAVNAADALLAELSKPQP